MKIRLRISDLASFYHNRILFRILIFFEFSTYENFHKNIFEENFANFKSDQKIQEYCGMWKELDNYGSFLNIHQYLYTHCVLKTSRGV